VTELLAQVWTQEEVLPRTRRRWRRGHTGAGETRNAFVRCQPHHLYSDNTIKYTIILIKLYYTIAQHYPSGVCLSVRHNSVFSRNGYR